MYLEAIIIPQHAIIVHLEHNLDFDDLRFCIVLFAIFPIEIRPFL